jgi:hypothetical protein
VANTALNRTVAALLTNKSGGALAYGDVVILDNTNAKGFTTTTSAGLATRGIGVIIEPNGIANNATGLVATAGWIPKITLNTAATIGQFLKTHTVAGQATPHDSPQISGDFAVALQASATPEAILFGSANGPVSSLAGPGSSTDNAIVRWDGAGGATLQDSAITIGDTGVIAFPDNIRQTFNPGADAAGLNVGSIAGDPGTPSNGDLWYDSTANELTARINGASVALGAGGGGTVIPNTNDFRLTTETGVPVSTTDQTGKSTIYLTPFKGTYIALYNGSAWAYLASAEVSLALSGLTSGKNYDVFAYNNGGTLTLELSAAWTNDTTRADALTTQDGVYVKSGATTRRHVGTIRTTSTTETADSGGGGTSQVGGKRFVWNRDNQVRRSLSVIDTTDSWSYGTDTVRQANGAAGNKVEYVTGDAALHVEASVLVTAGLISTSARSAKSGVGIDSTSAFSGLVSAGYITGSATAFIPLTGHYAGYPGLGYHYVSWNEKGADGTSTFLGDNAAVGTQSGMRATIFN